MARVPLHIAFVVALFATWTWTSNVSAQQPDISMIAPTEGIAAGQEFTLEIRVNSSNGSVDTITPPDLSRFTVLSESMSRPMGFSFSFGSRQIISQSTVVQRYRLVAKAPGRVSLSPARVSIGGRTYRTNSLTIEIQDPSALQAAQAAADEAARQLEASRAPRPGLDGANFDRTAFLRTVVDKATAYVGEQVTATLYLYVRGSLGSTPDVSREATTEGFWVQDLTPRDESALTSDVVENGVRFRVYMLKRMALFPLHEGTLTIGAMHLSAQTALNLDAWGISQPEQFDREGVPVNVTVRPIPTANRPQGDVYVGTYAMEARLDRIQVATGDAVTLTCTVHGRGNMRDLRLTVPQVAGLNILAPQVHDEITQENDVVVGTRTFEWLIVPQQAGTYSLATSSFVAFDPSTETFQTVPATPLELVAAGNTIAQPVTDAPNSATTQNAPERVNFGPIRPQSAFEHRTVSFVRAPWFLALLGAPCVLWLLMLGVRRVRRSVNEAAVANAPRRAVRGAKKRLAAAESLARAGDARAFYTEVARALKAVLEARLEEPVGSFTHPQLRAHLLKRGMQDELVTRVVEELEGGDFARFSASASSAEEMTHCRERVEALFERIDRFVPTKEDA